MDKKRVVMVAVIATLLIVTVVLLFSTGAPARVKVNPAFKDYVSAFTSGVISTESTVKVELANDYADSSMFEKPIETSLFSFSPDISGKAYWINTRTIEFRPDKALKANTLYTVKFKISEILNMPDSLKTFVFQFKTAKQAVDLEVAGHKAYDKKNLSWEKITASLRTADVADPEHVKEMISARQGDRNLKVSVVSDAERKSFTVVVDSVHRTKEAGSVEIKVDGSVIGADENVEKLVLIPSIDDFIMTGVKVFQNPEQYVLLQFSDPIQENQELAGIIKIGTLQELSFVVEDNEVRIYLTQEELGSQELIINKSLKNSMGKELKYGVKETITFENLKPDVRLIGEGVILPSSNGLIFPFEAVNLKAVDVTILKIYENNIAQFLQVNDLKGQRELSRVGKIVLKKTLQLSSATNAPVNYAKWNRFSIDLSDLIKAEPGAIYRVSLSFKKAYSLYDCPDTEEAAAADDNLKKDWEETDTDESEWDYYSDYNNYYDYDEDYYYYDWYNNDDPCDDGYYQSKKYSRNILASDIGLITKVGAGGKVYLYTANIVTAEPMSGVSLTFYDYQNQVIGKVTSGSEGMAEIQLKKTPHLLVASKDRQRAYLRLVGGSALSLSMFDVGGEAVRRGIKGFIYGERGVWRPGDSIYLTFILEDKLKRLPPEVPVSMTLLNPRGQKVSHIVRTKGVNGFYDFRTATDPSAQTGDYTAEIRVGGAFFSKTIKVETIKPNRLKILLDFNTGRILGGKDARGVLQATWLHGAIARNLRATVTMNLQSASTSFEKYKDFVFDDPTRRFRSEETTIFDGKLNEEGKADVSPNLSVQNNAPGVLKAYFETRVFEEGGEFSVDRFSLPYYPYSSYVGISVPKGSQYDFILETGKTHPIRVVDVDTDGRLMNGRRLKVDIYKVDWRWWWDNSGNDVADYVRSSYNVPIDTFDVIANGGKAVFNFKVEDADWGRYFIRVTDVESGHSTGKIVYADWPNWASRSREGSEGASMLIFSADKEKYQVGDEVNLTIPSSAGGRALVTIENGARVLQSFWVPTTAQQTLFKFKVSEDMAPNVYASVTLLQPHAQTANDLPIRLYGSIPILVENPNTHLKPVITMPAVLKPEENATISIREESGKAMTYTLAVVDDGLLDLTKFKTPDPWAYFYAREALGIKTWDLYDDVIGAYGGELERILSLGGGDDGQGANGKNRANRFKPMVKFFGPFALPKGQTKTVTFKMPQYIGSVRVMVIAGQDGAYGNAEKTVQVKKPLMLLSTLPRVLGPDETVELPSTIFAMEKNIKNVTVKVEAGNMFTVVGPAMKSITFNEVGDQLVNFTLKVKSGVGVGKVKVIANSGKEWAYNEIEIEVRNPNPEVTQVVEGLIKPGQVWNSDYIPVGIAGTNSGVVEFSSIPPVNLEKRLKYLVAYPYGCVEQTTSSVFPQLFLSDLLEMDDAYKKRVERNINAGIRRIYSMQTASGGIAYWPGSYEADEWGSNYAGHFLLEAKDKGYAVSATVLGKWVKFQRKRALAWTGDYITYYRNSDLIQAYRLYTLALAKAPELGAMNLLREQKNLSVSARWRLAAAYQLAGQPGIAKALVNSATTIIPDYREMFYTYGSPERDQAMIVETMVLMGQQMRAASLVKALSARLSKDDWMSTQSTAYCLLAISKYVKGSGGASPLMIEYTQNAKAAMSKTTSKAVLSLDMQLKGSAQKGKIKVRNAGKGLVYARIILQGIPAAGQEKADAKNMTITVNYTDTKGGKLDVSRLQQGTDFIAEVTVGNPGLMGGYANLALSTIFPSGWEIHNTRMDGYSGRVSMSDYDYIDYRDDRVYTFLNLPAKTSKTYRFLLNASYLGKFYLPAMLCEAMYDNTIYARTEGKWVEVVPYQDKVTARK
jgi:uncharacterized protein YfaS (alpha-2-macroglobulin family)